MNISSDKFPCRNRTFVHEVHEWLSTGETVGYTGAHNCQHFLISAWNNSSKCLTTLPLPCIEFETKLTMTPRHFNPYKRFTAPLNSSSFYLFLHFSLHFCSNFTLFMFVNICQREPHTRPIRWFYKKTRRILFFRLPPLNRFFSVSTLYSSFY